MTETVTITLTCAQHRRLQTALKILYESSASTLVAHAEGLRRQCDQAHETLRRLSSSGKIRVVRSVVTTTDYMEVDNA